MLNAPDGLLVLIAVLALAGVWLLAASEAAIRWISSSSAGQLAASGSPKARAVVEILTDSATALVVTSAVRILLEMTAAAAATLVLASLLPSWWLVLLAAIVVSVVLIGLLVGASPRRLGRRSPAKVLTTLAPLVRLLMRVCGPLVRVLSGRRAGREPTVPSVRPNDLLDMVERATESEVIEDDEREMVHSVFELGDTLTREVMVPRTDMVSVHAATPLRKAMSLFLRSGYSRVPVIGESVDDLLGVLYLKDVARRLQADSEAGHVPVTDVMRPAAFVPESKPVDDLLRMLQNSDTHIAIVVDEYGGIAGLVTIEDALEEIVGELTDEHDRATPDPQQLADGTFRVPARMPVDELGDLLGLDVDDDEVDSVGGLLAKALGKVPIVGASATIHGLHLVADQAEGRRRQIAWIRASAASEGER